MVEGGKTETGAFSVTQSTFLSAGAVQIDGTAKTGANKPVFWTTGCSPLPNSPINKKCLINVKSDAKCLLMKDNATKGPIER